MARALKSPKINRQMISAALFTAILIVYVSFLLIGNYRSLKHLKQHTLEQLAHETEKQAAAISYFFAERKNDLRNLADSPALASFFENKALGISVQNDLKPSPQAAAGQFERMQAKNFANGTPIYSRLLFIAPDGHPMIDTRSRLPVPDWPVESDTGGFGTPEAIGVATLEHQVALIIPYSFKDRHKGDILALLAVETIFDNLLPLLTPESQLVGLLHDSGRFYAFGEFLADGVGPGLQNHLPSRDTPIGRFDIPAPDGETLDVVAVRIGVNGTPFSLVKAIPSAAVFSAGAPRHQLAAMVVLALVLIAGAVQLWRTHTQRLVLRARLEESSKREAAVKHANDALRHEVEERRAAEKALKESEARFKNIFNSTHDGVAVYKPLPGTDDFVLVDINRAAENLERVKRSEIIGRCLSEVFPGAHALGLVDVLCRVRATGVPEQLPLALYQDDTRSGWRENFVYKLPSEEIVAIYQDKTEEVESEVEKRRIERHLRQAQKMEAIGTLAGGIAHDFNNILAAIMGYAEIVGMSVSESSPMQHDLKQILKAAHRAKDLILQILAFSRESEHEKKPVQLYHIVRETLQLLRASLPSTIDIQPDIDDDGTTIMADPIQMHQVIMNLCTNAHHAMAQAGGTLRVALTAAGNPTDTVPGGPVVASRDWIKLTVSDTGEGMPAGIIERIFDPYFTTKERGKGTGLGLAVVHGIVRDHGGSIAVNSSPGRGTTIDILLPRIDAQGPCEVSLTDPLPGGSETVLFVDDEQTLVELGELMLKSLGYQVIACTSSTDALEQFSSRPEAVDLVITDMTMPNLTGAGLAGRIRSIRPDVPIILCTGYSEIIDASQIGAMGIAELMMKPIRLQTFAETVRRTLDGRRLSDGI